VSIVVILLASEAFETLLDLRSLTCWNSYRRSLEKNQLCKAFMVCHHTVSTVIKDKGYFLSSMLELGHEKKKTVVFVMLGILSYSTVKMSEQAYLIVLLL